MTDFRNTIFRRHNIQELVGVYEVAKEMIEEAYEDLAVAEAMLKAAGVQYANTLPDRNRRFRQGENTEAERVLGSINEKIWKHVIDLMQIRTFLSVAKADELDDQLKAGKFPAITYDNIFNTFLSIMAQAKDFAADQIREVYDWLRPFSEDRKQYKTNSVWEIGKKVIKYGVEPPWSPTGNWRVDHYREQNFIALDKAFHTLDGAAMPKENYYGPLVAAIRSATWEKPFGDTAYFNFKLYKNGNIHITFKRPDLVKEFNRVAGGGMLRPKVAPGTHCGYCGHPKQDCICQEEETQAGQQIQLV